MDFEGLPMAVDGMKRGFSGLGLFTAPAAPLKWIEETRNAMKK